VPDAEGSFLTAEHYHALHSWMNAHPTAKRCVVALDRWLPLIPFVCYPVLLCLLNVRLFRLLGSILLVALRFAVPILILVAVILVVRHVRRRSARYRAEDEDRQEPKFHGPVYTVDYEEVPDSEDQKKDEGN